MRRLPFLLLVVVTGVVAIGMAFTSPVGVELVEEHLPLLVLLFALTALGELVPVVVPRGEEDEQVAVSTTFAFCLLLLGGVGPGAGALALSSVIADVRGRKAAWKTLFNASQYALSILAAGAVLRWLGREPSLLRGGALITTADLVPAALAAMAFFLVNNILVGMAVARALRQPVVAYLRADLKFQAGTAALLLLLAPVVAASADASLALVPLLVLPLAAVHRWASVIQEKDHEALHDSLTGLANRQLFRRTVDEAVRTAGRDGSDMAVLLIDLDGFKEVNDTLGHHHGDLLLVQVGAALEASLRTGDAVARLGGDEFAVLLKAVDASGAEAGARQLTTALQQRFTLGSMSVEVEASIGIALFPDDGADLESLLQRADVAMYRAKGSRSGFALYDADADPHSPARLVLLGELRGAIEEGQLLLHYQPKVRCSDGRIAGAEALVRWEHPERGLVMPAAFLPLAERTGLSRPLTLLVLRQALQQRLRWQAMGLRLTVSVNLSMRDLHDPSFAGAVFDLLVEMGTTADDIVLEVTESGVMHDHVAAIRSLRHLRRLGFETSLDDFGTGHASLGHLKHLPVDEVKIDRSFVETMTSDDLDLAIVETTLLLARRLGLRAVAEGVESQRVWERLGPMGCDLAQGYHLGRPVPADALTALVLEDDRPSVAGRLDPRELTTGNRRRR